MGQPNSSGLSWIFFKPTMVGWIEKTLKPDPTQSKYTLSIDIH